MKEIGGPIPQLRSEAWLEAPLHLLPLPPPPFPLHKQQWLPSPLSRLAPLGHCCAPLPPHHPRRHPPTI